MHHQKGKGTFNVFENTIISFNCIHFFIKCSVTYSILLLRSCWCWDKLMLLPVLPHLLILVFILLAACKESIALKQKMNKAKRPCDINPSTKIGCTNIQVTTDPAMYHFLCYTEVVSNLDHRVTTIFQVAS